MLRRSELPLLSELHDFEDCPALRDPPPEWFATGLKPSLREDEENDDGLVMRSRVEQTEALSKAWRAKGRERRGKPARRARFPHSGCSHRGSDNVNV
jgi:hypothetical protein